MRQRVIKNVNGRNYASKDVPKSGIKVWREEGRGMLRFEVAQR